MKEMCYKRSPLACPTCGSLRFAIVDMNASLYTTNGEGDIVDYRELRNSTFGKCLNCGDEYEMITVSGSFIPMTPLRSLLGDYGHFNISNEYIVDMQNPMLEE